MSLALCLASCKRRDQEAERRAALAATFNKLRSCAPHNEAAQPAGRGQIAIASVTRAADETTVRLIAYALNEPLEFALPVYSLSRGRWLINEQGRAYLLDEQCREYKLKERKAVTGPKTPLDGRIKLQPGQVIEATLSFPRLPDEVQMGVLVYAGRSLPFSF